MKIKKLYDTINKEEYIIKYSPKEIKSEASINESSIPFVAPVSIGLIIEGVKLLLDLFGLFSSKQDTGTSKIGEWAKEIADELNRMNKLLEDVRDALRDLKIYIDESQKRDAEFDVLAKCQTYIDNLENFKSNINDPLIQQQISNVYINLQDSVRKCMRYGYAPAFTVTYAYMVEVDLMKLLNNDRDDSGLNNHIRQVSKTYSNYIDLCLDSHLGGNFTSLLNTHIANIEKLEKNYCAGDKGLLPRAPFYYKEGCKMVRSGGHDGDHESHEVCAIMNRYNPAYRIKGSITTGFTGETFDIGSNYGDSTARPEMYCHGFAEANMLANKFLQENVLPEYDKAIVAYSEAISTKEAMEKAIESLSQIKNLMLTAI